MSKDKAATLIKSLISNMKKSTKQQTGLKGLGKFHTWRGSMTSRKKEEA